MEIKLGDTFLLALVVKVDGAVQDLTGWSIRAGASNRFGVRHPFEVEFTDRPNGAFTLSADTSGWLAGNLSFDIRYTTDSGQVVTTKSVPFLAIASDSA